MIEQFKVLLKQFTANQISLHELENGLAQLLSANPASKEDVQHVLLELMTRKLITKPVFDSLYTLAQKSEIPHVTETADRAEPPHDPVNSKQMSSGNTRPSLVSFQDSLKLFQGRQCTYEHMEACLLNDVKSNPELDNKYRQIIRHLENNGILNSAVAERLLSAISNHHNRDTNNEIISNISANKPGSNTGEDIPLRSVHEEQASETSPVDALIEQFSKQAIDLATLKSEIYKLASYSPESLQTTVDDVHFNFQSGYLDKTCFDSVLTFLEEELHLDLKPYRSEPVKVEEDNLDEGNPEDEHEAPGLNDKNWSAAPKDNSIPEKTPDADELNFPEEAFHTKIGDGHQTADNVSASTIESDLTGEEVGDADKTILKSKVKATKEKALKGSDQETDDSILDDNAKDDNAKDDNAKDDKTQIRASKSAKDSDSDKTQFKRSSDVTSQTSKTSQTSNTSSTESKWANRPFENIQDVEPLKLGDVLKDRYELLDFIGRGGMGDVFKARDKTDSELGEVDSIVAVKVLNKEFREHPDSLKALQREAKKTRELAHPHIVNVHVLERDAYHVFMAMELLEGQPLNAAIKEHRNGFEWGAVKKYIRELGDALQYAHRRNVIHSDLKPGNIFISNGEIKVFDFGIARAANVVAADKKSKPDPQSPEDKDQSSGTGFDVESFFDPNKRDDFDPGELGALTPTYASPEMLAEELNDADPRDDIYALGCITYELLTGKHPFLDEKNRKIEATKARDAGLKPPKIASLKPWQQNALERTLAFEREARTPSVDAFLQDFLREKREITSKQILLGVGGAISFLGLSIAGYVYLDSTNEREFLSLLSDGNHDELYKTTQIYLDVPEDSEDERRRKSALRNKVFQNDDIRSKYRPYIESYINELTSKHEYSLAENLISQAIQVYPEIWVQDLKNDVMDKRQVKIAELDQALVALENAQDVINFRLLDQLWSELKNIESENKRLQNQTPAIRLNDSIAQLIVEEKYDEAREMAEYALSFYQRDLKVFGGFVQGAERYLGEVSTLSDQLEQTERLTRLQTELPSLEQFKELAVFNRHIDVIKELFSLDTTGELTIALQNQLSYLVQTNITQMLADKNWNEAKQLIASYSEVLSTQQALSMQSQVSVAEQEFINAINAITAEIQLETQAGNFGAAQQSIEKLKEQGAEQSIISGAYNTIAQRWLLETRKLKNSQRWNEAQAAARKGLELPNAGGLASEFDQELESIASFQNMFENQVEAERIAQLQKQRTDNINRLVTQINQVASEDTITLPKIISLQNYIAELAEIDAENQVIVSAQNKVLITYLIQIDETAEDSPVAALEMAQNAFNILPGEIRLENKIQDLKTQIASQKVAEEKERLRSLETQLIKLIDEAQDNRQFNQVIAELAKIEVLQEDQNAFKALKERAANAYIEIALNLRDQQRFSDAYQSVEHASELSPNLTSISVTRKSIADTESEFNAAQELVRKNARIGSLQQSFLSQVRALDLESAQTILKELRNLVPNSDNFLNAEVPKAFGEAYTRLGERALAVENYQHAKNRFEEALQEDPLNSNASELLEVVNGIIQIESIKVQNPGGASAVLAELKAKYSGNTWLNQIDIPEKIVVNEAEPPPETQQPTTKQIPKTNSANSCRGYTQGMSIRQRFCFDMLPNDFKGPRMVVIPPHNGRQLAISRYEIRVEEYNFYCQQTNRCQPLQSEGNMPATGMTITEAEGFVDYLSEVTGETYRIPTVSEWQHAALSGGEGRNPKSKNCKAYANGHLARGFALEVINFDGKNSENNWGMRKYLGNASELVKADNNPNSYFAMGGSFEDPMPSCTVDKQDAVRTSLKEATGLRIVKNISG